MASPLSQIHLLCMETGDIDAFEEAREAHGLPADSPLNITTHSCALSQLDESVKFDAMVSPANSYGRLDGGFDDAISRTCSPEGDYLALTHVCQAVLYDRYRGFAPPGTCTLVRIPPEFAPRSRNVWGAKFIALCPTMRMPSNVRWDREIVYEAVWSLLCAVDLHNREAEEQGRWDDVIRSVLMTPFATATGRVSNDRWAAQLVLALKHYLDALARPARWSALDYKEIMMDTYALEKTWKDITQ